MHSPPSLGIVFVALAVVFLGAALRDYLKAEGKLTIARIWGQTLIIIIKLDNSKKTL